MIKIATWNVNSVRARFERLLNWLEKEKPSVLCLQELKGETSAFPHEEVAEAGYFPAVYGQKTYNGVAILSRSEPTDIQLGWPAGPDDPQARLIAATVDGIRILSAYVPNGKVVGSDKWAYKLNWLDRLHGYLQNEFTAAHPIVLTGDLNIAPEDRDVADPERWAESVLCHPDARKALNKIVDLGFVDTMRLHHQDQGPYSWWDYRRLAFPKNDGLRIDFIYSTPVLAGKCNGAYVDRDERKGTKPSDHAPVVALFDI